MVNWDPKALTALSDEEVIYKEEHGKLYYLRYKVEGDPEGRFMPYWQLPALKQSWVTQRVSTRTTRKTDG